MTRWFVRLAAPAAAAAALVWPAAADGAPSPTVSGSSSSASPSPAPVRCSLSSGTVTAAFDGVDRTYRLVVPPGASPSSPLLVSMHGATGSAAQQEAVSGLSAYARSGAVVLYPQATGTAPATMWRPAPGSADVRFVASLVAKVQQAGCGSPASTSLSGFSQGAMMVSRLLCENSDLFASAVLSGGVLPPTSGCVVPSTTSLLVVHGAKDATVPFSGELPNVYLRAAAGGDAVSNFPGVDRAQMAGLWAAVKGCPVVGLVVPGPLVEVRYTGCGSSPTVAVVVPEGGHTWDPPGRAGWVAGQVWALLHGSRGFPGRPVPAGGVVRVATGAAAGSTVFGNMTVTAPGGAGHTTVYPCDEVKPTASTNNFTAGQTTPNFVAVRTDAAGEFCVFTSAPAHLLFDMSGSSQVLPAQTPQRVLDTRSERFGAAKVPAGGVVRVATGAAAGSTVFGNMTVTAPGGAGHTTVYPCDEVKPTASTNNFTAGQTTPNFVAVRTDAAGEFCVFTSAPAHLLFDMSGSSQVLPAQTPQRVLDTRQVAAS